MKAIGIDLGTTNSLVAVVEEGRARALTDDEGRALLPSVVSYPNGEAPFVGYDARDAALERPLETIVSVKRLMGRTREEALALGHQADRLQQEGSVLRVVAGGEARSPVEISAEILRSLRDRARASLGAEVKKAVITVPAYFDDTQRQATKQAGMLAGLEVMRLLNEPTAAALAYGLDKRREGHFAVFDLGGGTFDISILHLVDGVFEVLSTGGDPQLGGDDFDRAVADRALSHAGVQFDDVDAGTRRAVLVAAEELKITLTDHFESSLAIEVDGTTHEWSVSRDEYEAVIGSILQRVTGPCRQALRDASLRAEQLDGVVLVGGSTRSPFVQRYVAELFRQQPLGDIDPDEVVALGAASQADLLSVDSELRLIDGGDVLLLDIIPLSLGLETMGGVVEKVLPRCTQIPASRAQEFTTFKEGQTGMDVHVLQGERELVGDCRSLARFRLTGIPPAPAGVARVRVTFQIDADGILRVRARELTTGIEQSIQVEPSHGLNDAQIEQMLMDSLDFAEADVAARLLATARVEAERVLMPLQKALSEDADLLSEEEQTVISSAMGDLTEAMKGADHGAIQDLIEILDKVSAGFAQRRMERALNQGLTNTNINELSAAIAPAADDDE
jgi:molecular chaperone HscA